MIDEINHTYILKTISNKKINEISDEIRYVLRYKDFTSDLRKELYNISSIFDDELEKIPF